MNGNTETYRQQHKLRLSYMPWLYANLKPNHRSWAQAWQDEWQAYLMTMETIEIDLTASRTLTDTSFGSGNLDVTAGLPSSDGSSPAVDRIDRTSAGLDWQTQVFCGRCQFSTGISAIEDDYLEDGEKSLSLYARARFSYSFSQAANLSLGVARADVDFDDDSMSRDYELNTVSIEYKYHFKNGINTRLSARNEDRVSTSASGKGTYDENIYSISLGYDF